VVPKEQPQRCRRSATLLCTGVGRDEQDAAANHESGQRSIAVRVWIPESMGLVDNKETVRDGRGR